MQNECNQPRPESNPQLSVWRYTICSECNQPRPESNPQRDQAAANEGGECNQPRPESNPQRCRLRLLRRWKCNQPRPESNPQLSWRVKQNERSVTNPDLRAIRNNGHNPPLLLPLNNPHLLSPSKIPPTHILPLYQTSKHLQLLWHRFRRLAHPPPKYFHPLKLLVRDQHHAHLPIRR